MQKLKVAIIGCGGAGANHAEGYHRSENIELVGVSDIDFEKAQSLSEKYQTNAFKSYEEMIESQQPDVVSVCTREYDHTEPTLFALQNDCHVFCEKIMAADLEDAEQMVKMAEKHERILGVNYNYRYIDSIQTLKSKIDSGKLGEIRHLTFHVHAYCHHHSLDLILYLTGYPDEVISVLIEDDNERNYAWYDADKLLYIPSVGESTTFKTNNTLITLHASHHSFNYPLMEIDCIGTKGRLHLSNMTIDNMNGEALIQHEENKSEIPNEKPISLDGIFYRSVAGFIDSIRGQSSFLATGFDGLKVMKMESAISRSHQDQTHIKLERNNNK